MPSHIKYTQTKTIYYLPSIFRRHLPSSNIIVSSNPNLYELATTNKKSLHFILSDNDNYDFDVKVRYCGFVGFVNDVVDCGCLGCVLYFRIKEKEKKKEIWGSISTYTKN